MLIYPRNKMKIVNVLLFSFIAVTYLLSASECVVEKFNPPICFNSEGFKEGNESEWATAFLARKAPSQVTFHEFNETISDTVKKKYGVDEEAYREMVARAPKSQAYGSILAEVKFTHENEEFIMLIIYPMELSEYPKSKDDVNGFMSKLFFKKMNDHWISWMTPHDMAFDDPIIDIAPPHEALGLSE